jgi:hypothetical protein
MLQVGKRRKNSSIIQWRGTVRAGFIECRREQHQKWENTAQVVLKLEGPEKAKSEEWIQRSNSVTVLSSSGIGPS